MFSEVANICLDLANKTDKEGVACLGTKIRPNENKVGDKVLIVDVYESKADDEIQVCG